MSDPRHWPKDMPGSATDAVAFLVRTYRHRHDRIATLDDEGLRRPLGAKGSPYANNAMGELITHNPLPLCPLQPPRRPPHPGELPLLSTEPLQPLALHLRHPVPRA
ncbi:hypothetical protein P6B95_00680 [Streptomyces atratus]|uniref:hypothetical protein n=1 Tax=Streptomyces atratus TaxID=1893 RepID=UPI0016705F5C|nr:hypothetical protein [Streptomyces atratus]WPW26133.1 hypothetical protein P6B95_00680 [Streptomyces atratus]